MLDRKPAVMAELVMLAVVAAIKFRPYRSSGYTWREYRLLYDLTCLLHKISAWWLQIISQSWAASVSSADTVKNNLAEPVSQVVMATQEASLLDSSVLVLDCRCLFSEQAQREWSNPFNYGDHVPWRFSHFIFFSICFSTFMVKRLTTSWIVFNAGSDSFADDIVVKL